MFWKLIEDHKEPQGDQDPSFCWQHVVNSTQQLCTPNVAKIVPAVLATRQYAAKLQLYRSLAEDLYPKATWEGSCCLVDLGGHVFTTPQELEQALVAREKLIAQDVAGVVFDFDHVYTNSKGLTKAVSAILYGPIGASCFSAFHTLLAGVQQNIQGAPFLYVYRPFMSPACEVTGCLGLGAGEQLVLPGYGVEATLKNTEYSAMDDKKVKDKRAGGGDPSVEDQLGEVKGIVFDRLVERKPHLRQELLTFRDHLLSSDDEDTLKVWDLRDSGLQATQRILSASDPLSLLVEISQNFPSLVSSLSRQAVAKDLRSSVSKNQQLISPGMNFMLVNGLLVDINNFELYGFLNRLRAELRLRDSLAVTGLEAQDLLAIMSKRVDDKSGSDAEVRLDLSPMEHILFFNNLEKDAAYARYTKSIVALLNVFPGQMVPMARNLFNVIFIANPLAPAALRVPSSVVELMEQAFPIRFGVIFLVPDVIHRVKEQSKGGHTLVPAWQDMAADEQVARIYLTLAKTFGPSCALHFWALVTKTARNHQGLGSPPGTLKEGDVKKAFEEAWMFGAKSPKGAKARLAAKKTPEAVWEQVISGSGYAAEVGMQLQEHTEHAITKGITSFVDQPRFLVNGQIHVLPEVDPSPSDNFNFIQSVLRKVMEEQQEVQASIYYRRLSDDDDDLLDAILDLHTAVRRWNPSVLVGPKGQDSTVSDGPDNSRPRIVNLGTAMADPVAKGIKYVMREGGEATVKPVTFWISTDLHSPEGRSLVVQALRFMVEESKAADARLAFFNNPAVRQATGTEPVPEVSYLEASVKLVVEKISELGLSRGYKLLKVWLSDVALCWKMSAVPVSPEGEARGSHLLESVEKLFSSQQEELEDEEKEETLVAVRMVLKSVKETLASQSHEVAGGVKAEALFVREKMGLSPGDQAVVTNGRLVSVNSPQSAQDVLSEDFSLMHLVAMKYQPGEGISKAVKEAHRGGRTRDSDGTVMDPRQLSDVVMVAASALGAQQYSDINMDMNSVKQIQTAMNQLTAGAALEVGSSGSSPPLHLVAILNPLTRGAQRMAQVLSFLKKVLDPALTLYLNPQVDLSELPLKSFYRYALPEFTHEPGFPLGLPSAPTAYFPRLPQKRVLTLQMDVPEAWLVEPAMALHDLDNLKLIDVPESVAYAEFELEAIMLTGACSDKTDSARGAPPRGLQLHLGTLQQPHVVDTLVMANLGYFQLKAGPGLWQLSLAPGRSTELYELAGGVGEEAGGNSSTLLVAVSSFSGKRLELHVKKKPGKEHEDVLNEESPALQGEEAGLWDKMTSYLSDMKGKKTKPGASGVAPAGDVVNVFTVASGHMYERLQKIMILSVLNNTKARCKFWIIKNFMSPHHKRVIPEMAKHFGFDYEFVTYKWPHWLHKQTDKQRMIWAYKILFLDVLFPLDVDRIIFVDSDQVVRTDLNDLMKMDLKGAPYGYTPFCQNNKEMDPYRFWNGGFWKEHLRGKPYHISALYVIDLKRFRNMAAGDNLRVMYEQLSKDPNSLANLDQDLPNYAQHTIPIFSLPQEWLWCESWCGNETKAQAKTIDLCNNPKTKEPKLVAARRIIAEWNSLDEMQRAFTETVDRKILVEAGALTDTGGDGMGGDNGASSGAGTEGGPADDGYSIDLTTNVDEMLDGPHGGNGHNEL